MSRSTGDDHSHSKLQASTDSALSGSAAAATMPKYSAASGTSSFISTPTSASIGTTAWSIAAVVGW